MEHVRCPNATDAEQVARGDSDCVALFIVGNDRSVVHLDDGVLCGWVDVGEFLRCGDGRRDKNGVAVGKIVDWKKMRV